MVRKETKLCAGGWGEGGRGAAVTNQALDKLGLCGVDHALGVGVVVPLILADLPEKRVDTDDGIAAVLLARPQHGVQAGLAVPLSRAAPVRQPLLGPTPHQSRV
jgi:hypothetical protein